ncbi:MAG: flagellar basal body-associated FliL family protein [Vampirovibrionales bacterium]|nr:flagellar basal body-associated FliL family protein [Vampirovibrionales bacterium]
MSQAVQPKSIKPKTDTPPAASATAGASNVATQEEDELTMVKLIILVVAIVLSSVLSAAAAMYVLGPMVLVPAIVAQMPEGGSAEGEDTEEKGDAEAHGNSVGMNLELEEFTVNLKPDPTRRGNQYLRAKIAMSIKVPPEQDCAALAEHEAPAEGGGGGHGGGAPAGDPMEACSKKFNSHMSRYVPSIRDIVNTALMSRTSGTLASSDGQEALKDDVREEVNHLIASDGYEVIRVNFSDFIVQY